MANQFEKDLSKTQIAFDSKSVTGFTNIADSEFAYVEATRIFTLQSSGTTAFRWYENYAEHNSTIESIVLENTSGSHLIYLRSGNLHELVNPTVIQIDEIIRNYLPVAYCYMSGAVDYVAPVTEVVQVGVEGDEDYVAPVAGVVEVDEVIGTVIFKGDNRRGLQMDPATHSLIHWRDGLSYLSGLQLVDISADGDGSTDAMCQVGVDEGGIISEDSIKYVDAILSTTGIPVFHELTVDGEGDIWQRTEVDTFAVRPYDVSPETIITRLAYNENDTGDRGLAQCDESTVTSWTLFATTDVDQPIICIMGTDMFATIELAKAGAITQIYDVMENATLSRELRPIGTFYCDSDTAYTNSVNAIVISTATSTDFDDWRHQNVSRTQKGLS